MEKHIRGEMNSLEKTRKKQRKMCLDAGEWSSPDCESR